MGRQKSYAETYLGRHLGDRSKHPDLSGYMMAQGSLWSGGDIRTFEKGSTTTVEVNFGSSRITYSYRPVADEDVEPSADTLVYVKQQPWRYRELVEAEIYHSAKDVRLDLIEELPAGWQVFVDLADEPTGYCFNEDNTITVSPHFGNKFHYFTLAHEVGHAWDATKNPRQYEHARNRTENDARTLACERNASAYALYRLRPFMSANPEDILHIDAIRDNYAKSLQTYTDHITNSRERYAKKVSLAKIGCAAIVGAAFTAQKIRSQIK